MSMLTQIESLQKIKSSMLLFPEHDIREGSLTNCIKPSELKHSYITSCSPSQGYTFSDQLIFGRLKSPTIIVL